MGKRGRRISERGVPQVEEEKREKIVIHRRHLYANHLHAVEVIENTSYYRNKKRVLGIQDTF